jgi:hypothetical protein
MGLFDKARGLVSQGIGAVRNAAETGVDAVNNVVADPTIQNIAAAVPQGQIINAIRPGTTDQIVQGGTDIANRMMPGMDGMMQQAQNQMPPGMDGMMPQGMGQGQMMAQGDAAMRDQLSNLMQMSGRVDSKIAMKSAKMFGTNEYRNQK